MKLLEVLQSTTGYLQKRGIESPRLNAEHLLAHSLGKKRIELYLEFERDLSEAELAPLRELVRRRGQGEPLQHLLGTAEFCGRTFLCDKRALIPRPETEGLADLVLERVPGGRVADVGTGSGCVALSLAAEGRYETVVALDLSKDALGLAEENRRLTGGRVSLVRGDLCDPLRPESLDALVSNPPYLTTGEYAVLDPAVRDWEPRSALEAGSDGLEAIARLLAQGRTVVRPGGWLALEIDSARAALCAWRAGESGWTDVAIHADLFGRERYLLARRSDAP